MAKWLKIVLIVLVIFAVLGFTGFIWAKNVWNKITFGKPRLQGLNLNGLTPVDLANALFNSISKDITVTLAMDVKNDNNFSIPFSSLKVKLFYNDAVIAETSDMLSGKQSVAANATFTATDTVTVTLNDAGLNMLIEKAKGNKVKIDYKILVKVFGIPLPKALQTQSFEF